MNGEKPKRGLANGGLSAWAYVLIGLGVIFLVINLFNISLLRLWPLLLVAIGLTLLFGRASGGGTHTGQFAAPRAGVDEADIEVHLSVGQAQIRPLPASSDLLLDAELTYVGDIDFRAEGGRVEGRNEPSRGEGRRGEGRGEGRNESRGEGRGEGEEAALHRPRVAVLPRVRLGAKRNPERQARRARRRFVQARHLRPSVADDILGRRSRWRSHA